MERERSRQEQTADTDKLYPQIAEALNISISQLEQYPSDMKQILCQAYINNCELGKRLGGEDKGRLACRSPQPERWMAISSTISAAEQTSFAPC